MQPRQVIVVEQNCYNNGFNTKEFSYFVKQYSVIQKEISTSQTLWTSKWKFIVVSFLKVYQKPLKWYDILLEGYYIYDTFVRLLFLCISHNLADNSWSSRDLEVEEEVAWLCSQSAYFFFIFCSDSENYMIKLTDR